MATPADVDLIPVPLAAAILRVRAATVYDRIRKGYMHAQRTSEGRVLVSRREVDHWRAVGCLPAGRRTTPTRVLSVQQAAALLSLTPAAVYQRVHRGRMIAVHDAAGHVLIPRTEVAYWQRRCDRERNAQRCSALRGNDCL